MRKATVKYQLIRDGDHYNAVYDLWREAETAGRELIACGWITKFIIVPVRAIWLKA